MWALDEAVKYVTHMMHDGRCGTCAIGSASAFADTPHFFEWGNTLLVSRTVRTLLFTTCQGKALSVVALVLRRHGFEAW